MANTRQEPPRRYTDFAGLRLLRRTPRELKERKANWAYAIVRSHGEIGDRERMPAGTLWLVTRNHGGLELEALPCRCGRRQAFVDRVPEEQVTYIGQLPDSRGEPCADDRAREAARELAVNGCAPDDPAEAYAVERVRERVAASVAGQACSEHTIVIGGDAARRRRVMDQAAIEAAGTGALVARLDGAKLSPAGANAIWRAAADRTGPAATDEDVAPLGRLVDLEGTGADCVAVCIDALDAAARKWRERDEAWTLRHTLQNEPRVVVIASCGTFPPGRAADRAAAAWNSFAISDIETRS